MKMTNNIDWSWIYVFSPIWIFLIVACISFLTVLIVGRIKKGKW
ncbi:MAG: hypothetical protein Q3984_05320 [Eubacteriales bacterium]|nr:hypothetical protein [Eubacteriales bacterium]